MADKDATSAVDPTRAPFSAFKDLPRDAPIEMPTAA